MKINYLVTKDSIHLNFNGSHISLNRNHRDYDAVRDAIKNGDLESIPDLLSRPNEVKVEEYIENSGLVLVDGNLQDLDGNVLPRVLSNRLKELKEEGFPVTPLVNFWNNLKENPSMNSREQLFKFLEQNGHPLTDDGYFVAYRGVSASFKDLRTGQFDNTPGQVLEMPRNQVDDNPNVTCSHGFHVAAWEYAKSFGPITVEVKVNPRDVVAVPNDYNGQKMRVDLARLLLEKNETVIFL